MEESNVVSRENNSYTTISSITIYLISLALVFYLTISKTDLSTLHLDEQSLCPGILFSLYIFMLLSSLCCHFPLLTHLCWKRCYFSDHDKYTKASTLSKSTHACIVISVSLPHFQSFLLYTLVAIFPCIASLLLYQCFVLGDLFVKLTEGLGPVDQDELSTCMCECLFAQDCTSVTLNAEMECVQMQQAPTMALSDEQWWTKIQ